MISYNAVRKNKTLSQVIAKEEAAESEKASSKLAEN